MPFRKHETAVSFDPGIGSFGVAVLVNKRPTQLFLLTTDKDKKLPVSFDDHRRLVYMLDQLREIVEDINPHYLVAEIPSGGAQSSAAAKYLAYSAAILAACRIFLDLPIGLVTPIEIKKDFGEGEKGKKTIIDKALRMYPELNWPKNKRGGLASDKQLEHCADAIAAFHTWSNKNEVHSRHDRILSDESTLNR